MKGTYLSASSKRIQKELAEISLDPPCNCSAGPKGDNLHDWVSTLLGPTGRLQPELEAELKSFLGVSVLPCLELLEVLQ